jgi:predicted Na+-dependent transporter
VTGPMNIGATAITISMAITMLYTGLLFDPVLFRQQAGRHNWGEFGSLAAVNYLLVPLATLGLVWLGAFSPVMNMVLLTLAIFPCAPLVPALVGMSGEPPDWSLFIFLSLSLLNLALVPVLMEVLAMPWAAGNSARLTDGDNAALLRYVLSVYGPMALGAAIRQWAPSLFSSLLNLLRRALKPMMLVVFVLFMYTHLDEILRIGLRELGTLFLFEAICIVFALLFVRGSAKNRVTNVLITALRNFAMGIAFAAIVFPHTPALSYMMTFTSIVIAGGLAWVGLTKLLSRSSMA